MILYRVLCGEAEWLLQALRGVGGRLLGLLNLHGSRRHWVQEVPDEDGVVVRAADDLEIVKLQPEHPPRVFLQRERERWAERRNMIL